MNDRVLPRLMIAAPSSGAGKTTVTCALLAALSQNGRRPQAFKNGPDYIDPMFHREVVKTKSANLDLFLMGEEVCRSILYAHARDTDIAVMESAMGYYDGIANTEKSSGYDMARLTQMPVVLVLDARKVSLSLAATVHGFKTFREDSNIAGVILNFASQALHDLLAPAIEREAGVPVLGYMPNMPECTIESRELGLTPAAEIEPLHKIIDTLAEQFKKTVNLDALCAIAEKAPALQGVVEALPRAFQGVKVAIAQDAAFCFVYQDALALLESMGAEPLPFSPLWDRRLPDDAHGLYLPGGYPERYAARLSSNVSMRGSIRAALEEGLPCIAECGGFIYLHETAEDTEGISYPMVGFVPAHARRTKKLSHFGYAEVTAMEDTLLLEKDESLPAHVFHYWESNLPGDALLARKPLRDTQWRCGVCTDTLFAGLFQMHLCANPNLAARFLSKCMEAGKC